MFNNCWCLKPSKWAKELYTQCGWYGRRNTINSVKTEHHNTATVRMKGILSKTKQKQKFSYWGQMRHESVPLLLALSLLHVWLWESGRDCLKQAKAGGRAQPKHQHGSTERPLHWNVALAYYALCTGMWPWGCRKVINYQNFTGRRQNRLGDEKQKPTIIQRLNIYQC